MPFSMPRCIVSDTCWWPANTSSYKAFRAWPRAAPFIELLSSHVFLTSTRKTRHLRLVSVAGHGGHNASSPDPLDGISKSLWSHVVPLSSSSTCSPSFCLLCSWARLLSPALLSRQVVSCREKDFQLRPDPHSGENSLRLRQEILTPGMMT